MFGLRNLCLCVLKIMFIKRKPQPGNPEKLGNPDRTFQKPITNQNIDLDNIQDIENLKITKLVRQFAECNYDNKIENKIYATV